MRNLKAVAGSLILAVAGLMAIPGLASASTATTRVPADFSTRYICIINTSQRCLDRPAQGSQLQIDAGVQWEEFNAGTVTSSSPFTLGSGYNGYFDGYQMIEFADPSNTSLCVRVNSAAPTKLTWGGCGTAAYFVENGCILTSVGATNDEGLSRPAQEYSIGTSGTAQGTKVYAEQNDSYQCWSY